MRRFVPAPLEKHIITMENEQGWDGKLRIPKKAVVTNAEILSDPEQSDEDAPPVEHIVADQGIFSSNTFSFSLIFLYGRSS